MQKRVHKIYLRDHEIINRMGTFLHQITYSSDRPQIFAIYFLMTRKSLPLQTSKQVMW